MGNRPDAKQLWVVALLMTLGCGTTRRLSAVADSVAANFAATEVSATLRTGHELIVTLTDPDSVLLLGRRDRTAVGHLARLAYLSYGDTATVRRVRVRLVRRSGTPSLSISRTLLDTLLLRWQLR